LRNLLRKLGKWTAVAVASFVALVIGVAIGAATGGDDSQPGTTQSAAPQTVTVAGTGSTETVTETISATKAERAKLDQRTAALAVRSRELRQAERALQREIGVVKRTQFSDGTFIVGKEVRPGTYRARAGGDCYWARLSGFGGNDIIVNGGFSRNQTVTISSSDKGFESRNCGTWHRIG
jgi:hypothetical protein